MSDKNNAKGNIEKILKELSKKDIKLPNNKEKNPLHVQTIGTTLEQYLDPFIIFGYDVNGDCVMLNNALTQKDLDSLYMSIQRYMMANASSGNMHDDIGDLY